MRGDYGLDTQNAVKSSVVKPDWSRVTLDDVRAACVLYDSGAARPRRPAKSTFLIFEGKTYPAKFIRGLAYRLATGVELDPSQDYSGGTPTARFFDRLGLTTQHESTSAPAPSASRAKADPPSRAGTAPLAARPTPSVRRRGKEPQKVALDALLRQRFHIVEREARFPWLTVPAPGQMDQTLSAIHTALQETRGYGAFARGGASLLCDFFVPAERLIIEYDERQHFTLQRAAVLQLYPPDLALGFDRQEWLTACRTIGAIDSDPPFRDEQRAFYDGVRDILAARNGFRLIRVRDGAVDWTGPGAQAQLDTLLASGHAPVTHGTADRAATPAPDHIRRVALVSHNYNRADRRGLYDYSEHFAAINALCDEQGCDTILYALFTWDPDLAGFRSHDAIFGGLRHVQRVILEVGQPAPKLIEHIEIWSRGQQDPVTVKQRFARSSDPDDGKRMFMGDLPNRRVADGLLVSCGETNIASLVRATGGFNDPYGFTRQLSEMNVGPILNPIHDFMTRYEMRKKRGYYSREGRAVLSVWNQGKRAGEAALPWTVYHDGIDRTSTVEELCTPFTDRPDIRIGVVDLASL